MTGLVLNLKRTTRELTAPLFRVGNEAPQGTDPTFLNARNIATAAASPHAFSDSAVLSFGSNLAYNSFEARFQVSGAGSYNHFAGFQVNPLVATSGTTTDFYSFFSAPWFDTGTVTNAYGLHVYEYRGTGTLTNAYGVYIASLNKGANRWAIKQVGAADLNEFAGRFEVSNRVRLTGDVGVPATGAGLELGYNAAYNLGEGCSNVLSFDRSGGVFKKLFLVGQQVIVRANGFLDTVTITSAAVTLGTGVGLVQGDAATVSTIAGGLGLANRMRITTDDWVPASGSGLELAYNESSNSALVFGFNRTAGEYVPLFLGGSTITHLTGLSFNILMTEKQDELTFASGKAIRLAGDTGPTISAGTGSPEGAVAAPVASLWLRTNGGTDTAVYRKETGAGNTGWVAMAAGGGGGGSILKGAAVVTFPAGINNYGVGEWTETVVATGVTAASSIFLALAAHNDEDENHETMLAFEEMSAVAGTDQITITLTSPELVRGPVKLNWMAA